MNFQKLKMNRENGAFGDYKATLTTLKQLRTAPGLPSTY